MGHSRKKTEAGGSLQLVINSPKKNNTRVDEIYCRLGVDLKFATKKLERFCFRRMSSTEFDFAILIGVIAYADRNFKRHRGKAWSRTLKITIPVHDIKLWKQNSVVNSLKDVLTFLTGDDWEFQFLKREKDEEFLTQDYIPFNNFQPSFVVPISGGMDSWAVTELLRSRNKTHKILLFQIKNCSASDPFSQQKETADNRSLNQIIQIPFKLLGGKKSETSYRTRSFVFYGFSALAAMISGCRKVIITENGQGSLGPSLLPFGDEWPMRGSHPGFSKRLSYLFANLFEVDVEFEHFALWKTKGELLKDLFELRKNLSQTYSCAGSKRNFPGKNKTLDCGICSNCLLTRMSIAASGFRVNEGSYVWDDLNATTMDESLTELNEKTSTLYQQTARKALQDLSCLATLCNENPQQINLVVQELHDCLTSSADEIQKNLLDLMHRHSIEWKQFLLSFSKNSWVREWASVWYEQ